MHLKVITEAQHCQQSMEWNTRRASQSTNSDHARDSKLQLYQTCLIPAAATSFTAAWVPSTHSESHLIIPLLWPCSFSCWKTRHIRDEVYDLLWDPFILHLQKFGYITISAALCQAGADI